MFDITMEANGGSNNAYTTQDVTVYTDFFPNFALEKIFDLESDRIKSLTLKNKVVESERGVVTNERAQRFENNNWLALREEVNGAAFRAHPYSWPVLGHQSDIDNWKKQDLWNFYRTYYAPNNAVVVVTGDVTLTKVRYLARHYFENIPAQKPPREVHTVEPPQKGERRVYVQKESASSPNIMIAFKVPATKHKDSYSLQVLSSILTDGKSSRLYRRLDDKDQIATEVSGYLPDAFDPTLYYLFAVAAKDVASEKIEKAIFEEISKLKEEGITSKELQKIKNQNEVSFYRSMQTISDKADNLGWYELFYGGYQELFKALDHLKAVTQADVKRVANTYLKKSTRTVGVLASWEDK